MISESSTDMELFNSFDVYLADSLEPHSVYRKVRIWKAEQPRGATPDGRPKWTYYAVIRFKDGYGILKGLSQMGIRAQIGRCLNGLTASSCADCTYHAPMTPISPERCAFTIDPEVTGFYGCPRFEPRRF